MRNKTGNLADDIRLGGEFPNAGTPRIEPFPLNVRNAAMIENESDSGTSPHESKRPGKLARQETEVEGEIKSSETPDILHEARAGGEIIGLHMANPSDTRELTAAYRLDPTPEPLLLRTCVGNDSPDDGSGLGDMFQDPAKLEVPLVGRGFHEDCPGDSRPLDLAKVILNREGSADKRWQSLRPRVPEKVEIYEMLVGVDDVHAWKWKGP